MSAHRFSQRYGYVPPRTALQFEAMDNALRSRLWLVLSTHCLLDGFGYGTVPDYLHSWWCFYLKEPHDKMPKTDENAKHCVRTHIMDLEWYRAYDAIEYFYTTLRSWQLNDFTADVNKALADESAAYRLVNGFISPIVDEPEIYSIEVALEHDVSTVREHLKRSLALLSDRQSPDFRNSMKEAISAVEALCKDITGEKNATLESALSKMDASIKIHPAMKDAFRKLYAFSGDAEGIRHALKDDPTVGIEDALFMLVTCSAFINYATAKALKARSSI